MTLAYSRSQFLTDIYFSKENHLKKSHTTLVKMVEKCEKKMNLFFGHLQLLVATTITYIVRSTHEINAIRCGTSTYFKENTFYIRIFQPPQNTLKSILIKSQFPLMKINKIHNSHRNILICTFHLCINIQLAIYAKFQNQYKY